MLPEGAALAILMQDTSPEAIQILLDELQFSWHETLGVPPNAEADAVRRAMAALLLAYHPDKGGTQAQMTRINEAYETACGRGPGRLTPCPTRLGLPVPSLKD